jgi:hypothetical protein
MTAATLGPMRLHCIRSEVRYDVAGLIETEAFRLYRVAPVEAGRMYDKGGRLMQKCLASSDLQRRFEV